MIKKFLLIILLPLIISCVTDEKLVGEDDDGDDNGGNTNPIELIYNEPLLLYNESLENIRSQEKRQFLSGSTERLTYTETKGSINYQISYYFENDRMTNASVVFDYDQSILDSLYEGLADKYEVISENPMIFNNKDHNRQIKVEYDISSNYISVDY